MGSTPGSGRSSGEGNSNPLQYSQLEKSHGERSEELQSLGLQRVGHDLVAKQQQGWDTDLKRKEKNKTHTYENNNGNPRGIDFTL